MEKEVFLKVDKLSKQFGKNLVLDNISLDIPAGKFYGIIGLSGSGKTTLLNILVGFWKPTSGRVTFLGKNIQSRKAAIRTTFGFGTQAGAVYSKLTIKENMMYFGRLYNMRKSDIKKRTEILLDLVELNGVENVLAEDLSTGMQRRLDIACSMLHNPSVLILDEPTEDLDPVLRKELLALIKRITIEGTTVIMASHLLDEVEVVCDYIAVLHKGDMIAVGTPKELKEQYSKNDEIHLKTKPGDYEKLLKNLKKIRSLKHIIVKRDKIILYTPDSENVLRTVLHLLNKQKEKLVDLRVHKPTIEEVFEAITKS
jgi:ABC-2 type transport system ATP-binding protein